MTPGRSYSGRYMIPGRTWQDDSEEICMIYGAIIWSDYDRPGRKTRGNTLFRGNTLTEMVMAYR